ncbi:MMPL family transporter [Myceligenerans pegani]|uniref:MMPL family transporter n=1 Tax=Myceligenerans pegani TaxID=2776917 RepID=A0ABR9MRY9_9MICO|nr:MMPL family transporter [Myceligenerans sp. TRM 65318]MBE1874143.1 MMPL family transporter [Myceligenerans sp. TRM 65318]MBE3016415.1 MMPL family transporter [Myceligenerans sp. TRM 65318]
MSSALYSLGRWAVRARRLVLVGWILVLALTGTAAGLLQQGLDNQVTIPGTESQLALDRLSATFPQVSGASAQVIVVAPEGSDVYRPEVRGAVEDGVAALGDISQVTAVTSPYDEQMPASVSDDDTATLLTIQLDGDEGSITDETKDALSDEAAALAAALPEGGEAHLGGQLFATEFPEISLVEGVGLLVALVVLVMTLGSLIAAGLPLFNALLGVGVSMALLFAATALGPISSTTPMLAVMLGLAVGIDYALFIVSRHREQLRDGLPVAESVARATATAGSAVVFAGLTVMIALVGLSVAGIPFLSVMGIAAAVTVGVTVVVSLTLLPAVLAMAGERLRPRVRPRAVSDEGDGEEARSHGTADRFFAGWVRGVTRFPALTVAIVVVALGALALPAMNLRLALPDAGVLAEDNSARVTYDLVSERFGDGFNGPLVITGSIVTSNDPVALMDEIGDELADLPGVADVPLATPNESADTGIVQVVPTGGPTSAETEALVHEIRSLHDHFLDTYGVDLAVTGSTAVGIDVSEKLGAALLPFALLVVGLSLVLLTMVFRSIAVPIKATVGYLLSVGAAFGVITLVFENGYLAELLGVTRPGPVISFMPIVLMGVLFGLAMDYEVFLVSRIREDYVHGRGRDRARKAIGTGFRGAAGVVTAAAVIMTAVFVAFVPHGDMNLKPIALGLAVGVFVDAFVVRMVLVPAVLALLGERAWWIPRKLDAVLPSFDVEGEGLAREIALADWPQPGARDAVAAERLVVRTASGTAAGPVSFRVPEGGALLVRGDSAVQVGGVLLAAAGRVVRGGGVEVDGKLKTTGLVLPERAAAVRGRAAVVDAGTTGAGHAPDDAVRRAVRERARLIVVDGCETVGDVTARMELAQALADAQRDGVAVIVGAVGGAASDLAPPGTPVLDVGAATGAVGLGARGNETSMQEVRR